MIDLYRELTRGQYEAALATLSSCIEECPDASWHEPVVNHSFCQAVFHTLFFADVYLGPDLAAVREQAFHREHAATFADYEELEDRKPHASYDKSFIRLYLEHCRCKAGDVLAAETEEVLRGPSGFDWLSFTRAEVHPYTIRHIQHHAAQLSMRLRLDHGLRIGWVKSGWK